MITKWKVFNFKSIRNETELELGPLTIFAGANSSGKSTFIQSILLIAQTLSNKVGSRSVVLNGALTSLGQFDDIKSSDSESEQISIKCTCRPIRAESENPQKQTRNSIRRSFYGGGWRDQLEQVDCEISFDTDPSSNEREIYQIQPRLYATQLSSVVRDDDNVDRISEASIRRTDDLSTKFFDSDSIIYADEVPISGLAYDVFLDSGCLSEIKQDFESAKPVGCTLQHFLPSRFLFEIDPDRESAYALASAFGDTRLNRMLFRRTAQTNIRLSEPVIAVLGEIFGKNVVRIIEELREDDAELSSLLDSESNASFSIRDLIQKIRSLSGSEQKEIQKAAIAVEDLPERLLEAMNLSSEDEKADPEIVPMRQPRQIFGAVEYLDSFFSTSVKYLGPLRDAPKPLYPLAPAADPYDVGLRGEHTASILELHKNKKIRYFPVSCFRAADIDRRLITRTLEAAVVDWLRYLGVANRFESKDMGKLGHELKVALSDEDSVHDLTHVGVGVSQVLPILVMCLLADEDTTLVFEQPELHLHPKVQTLLGDFFLSMSLCNKQCIVETHSEYLIDRLRFRMASASKEKELNSKAKIYFVEKPDDSSKFREVVINEYGAIPDWPEGFFDQSQQQAEDILRAAANKRKAKRRNEGE